MRKYAKYSKVWIDTTKQYSVLLDEIQEVSNIVPWFDENGIYYIGLEDFCLEYIDELDGSGL
ncbi:MAG: hypothetical protein IJV17_05285 [Prevotella sp.]|nr:hypothetical protein [Prevotella sp.]